MYDSPVAYLLNVGYRLIEKPLTVSFGLPCEGYMTLVFKLIPENGGRRNALLKVRGNLLLCNELGRSTAV